MVLADELLLPAANDLLACLCTAMSQLPEQYRPRICCIRAGDETIQDLGPYYDECCEGMAYVRIDGFYPTGAPDAPFPSPSSDFALSKCAPYAWGVVMEMGSFFCMPTEGPLDCDTWTGIAEKQMAQAAAMREALCCFMQPRDAGTVSTGVWQSKGRDGGCIGGIWPVTVMVDNPCIGC